MSIRTAVSVKQIMWRQQTPKARIIVHKMHRRWQLVPHPRTGNSEGPVITQTSPGPRHNIREHLR